MDFLEFMEKYLGRPLLEWEKIWISQVIKDSTELIKNRIVNGEDDTATPLGLYRSLVGTEEVII